jgi:hypothetical protein
MASLFALASMHVSHFFSDSRPLVECGQIFLGKPSVDARP